MAKIGKNDSCPCGSGKKFKRCCLDKRLDKHGNIIMDEEMLKITERMINLPKEPFGKDGFLTGRPFISDTGDGFCFRAVGNRVYKRDIYETFHEFILNIFAEDIGEKWLKTEFLKSETDQHLIAQWFNELNEKMKKSQNPELPKGHILALKHTGNIRALLSLAYDYYSLFHCKAKVLPHLLNRLRDKDNFQGARYEMSVGGIAVRAGFSIEWLNAKDKHCEFSGIHTITKDKVIFEAKSHHREGVLGQGKAPFNLENARIKIIDHIKKALDQSDKTTPLIIFDDLNLPLVDIEKNLQNLRFAEIKESLKKYGFPTDYKGTNLGALVITNFSWHFHDNLDNLAKNESQIIFRLDGQYALSTETIKLLDIATKQYGFVPSNLDEKK